MREEFNAELVLNAYCQGIFPMGNEDGGIRWYSPDPRCIFDFDKFHVSSRLARTVRQGIYEMRVDYDFEGIMRACAEPRADENNGVWITEELIRVYKELHLYGFAHSVEAYYEGHLAGGLYGVSIGGAFMGESMFFRRTDASKVALVYLVERLKERGFVLLDTQYKNKHLASFNAVEIPRSEYLARLQEAVQLDRRFA